MPDQEYLNIRNQVSGKQYCIIFPDAVHYLFSPLSQFTEQSHFPSIFFCSCSSTFLSSSHRFYYSHTYEKWITKTKQPNDPHVLGMREENKATTRHPCSHKDSMQTSHRQHWRSGLNPDHWSYGQQLYLLCCWLWGGLTRL